MLQFVLDTDHLTLYDRNHRPLIQHLAKRPPDAIGVTVVTVEEALRGRVAALARPLDGLTRIRRYAQLQRTVEIFGQLPVVPFDQASEDQFQRLLALRLRVGVRDLKIAAVVLANHVTLLTRNRRDFGRIPALVITFG
jgi:tRNA(fMet)-specific endonuclease VapC